MLNFTMFFVLQSTCCSADLLTISWTGKLKILVNIITLCSANPGYYIQISFIIQSHVCLKYSFLTRWLNEYIFKSNNTILYLVHTQSQYEDYSHYAENHWQDWVYLSRYSVTQKKYRPRCFWPSFVESRTIKLNLKDKSIHTSVPKGWIVYCLFL